MPGEQEIRIVESPACVDEVVLEDTVESVCPVTGMVDRYRVVVHYTPPRSVGKCRYVEALSFHGFLQGFRGVSILQEELASRIASALCRALGGGLVRVSLEGSHGPVSMRTLVARSCGAAET